MSNIKWIYPDKVDVPAEIVDLAGSDVIAKLLVQRGLDTVEKVNEFIHPETVGFSSPALFSEMEKAVVRVKQSIENKEHVVIYGDFDCDGVTSTALLYKALKYIGIDVSYYIPDRVKEGHGLNSAAVCKLISGRKAKLIITCDCGISNLNEVTLAKGLGCDVIITDHHEAPEVEPLAYAIINPKSKRAFGEDIDLKLIQSLENLAGVGVAYKLACALLEEYGKEELKDEIIHLVAIGTIADLVPMLGENRLLVKEGLAQIIKKQPSGVIKLLQSAGANVENGISADTVAFSIAPRINAAGRLESAETAVKLLTDDNQQNLELYVKQLDMNNRNRQQLCDTTFMEAEAKIAREIDLNKNKAIVLYDKNWHPGVIGIVASKIVEKYYRPAFMITVDEANNIAKCSARSIPGLHLYETLEKLSGRLQHFGGHALAAGFGLDMSSTNLDSFITLLNSTVNKDLDPKDMTPQLFIDADINSEDLSQEFIENLDILSPFGQLNTSPIFSMSDLALKQFKTMGSNNNHLKIFFSDNSNTLFEGVWWGKDNLKLELLDEVSVAFSPKVNNFRGNVSIQMEMKDIKKTNQPEGGAVEPQRQTLPQDVPVKWLDHRKKTNIQHSVVDYLKKSGSSISIFAENKDILAVLGKEEEFVQRIVNRHSVKSVDQIMFYDMPPSSEIFKQIIRHADPRMVHIMPYNTLPQNPAEIIKTLSGMLKYAHANKGGEVSVEEIALLLSVTEDMVMGCIKLLTKSGVIKYKGAHDKNIAFEFIQGTDLNTLIGYAEFKVFANEVQKVNHFRSELISQDTSELQKRLSCAQGIVLV